MHQEVREIKFIDILELFKSRKDILIFNVITITLISLVVSFILPELFSSGGLILPPEETFDPLTYGFTGLGEGYGGGLTKAILGRSNAPELWASMLKSRRIIYPIIDKYNLIELWDSKNHFEAHKNILEMLSIEISPEGVIEINVTSDDPKLSYIIANDLIHNLDKANTEIIQNTATNRKLFIEERLFQVKDSITILENNLLAYTTEKGIINIELEPEPLLEALTTLKAQEILLESELAGLSAEQTALHPQRRNIEAQLTNIRENIRNIEFEGGNGIGLGFSVPLESLPEITLNYARIKTEYLIQYEVYKILAQEYERARIAELKDVPSLKVVDWPVIPEDKIFPKKSLFGVIGLILGVIWGLFLIMLLFKFESYFRDPDINKKINKLLRF